MRKLTKKDQLELLTILQKLKDLKDKIDSNSEGYKYLNNAENILRDILSNYGDSHNE